MEDAGKVNAMMELLKRACDGTYESIAADLREARVVFHECVARMIEEPLRQKMLSMPHKTYSEKQQMASWVNGELRSMGLAVRCPKTGLDTTVRVDHGSNAIIGRFRLRPFEDSKRRTYSSVGLFPLQLTPHFQRNEPLAKSWTGSVKRGTSQHEEER